MSHRLARSSPWLRAALAGLACGALSLAGCGKSRSGPIAGAASSAAPPPLSSGPQDDSAGPQDDSADEVPDGSAPEGAALPAPPHEDIAVVRPRLIDDLLVNPGIGLQTFQRFDGQPLNPPLQWSEEGPTSPPADAAARANFPASSDAYFRWFWSQLEPTPGDVRYAILDGAIAAARAHGQTLSFRVMPYDEKHPLPAWLWTAGAHHAPLAAGERPDVLHPDYADPIYSQRWSALVAALGARYDGHPWIGAVDMASVGFWGEGGSPHPPTLPVRTGLLDTWFEAFRQTPLLVNFDEGKGMAYAASRGAGLRLDCLGDLREAVDVKGRRSGFSHMKSLYPQEIVRSGVQNTWQKRPVVLESCWTPTYWREHGWDAGVILAQALRWHASALNIKSTPIPPEQRPAFDNFLRRAGYRLELRQITYPKVVRPGTMMPVHLHWFNSGVAPPYRAWVVALVIASPEKTVVTRLSADVRTFLPDDAVIDASVYIPETLEPKKYRVRIGLLDPLTGVPAVRLGIVGRKDDGYYDLGWITVK